MSILTYTIETSPHFRTMTLIVHTDGHISVRVPPGENNASVKEFVRKNTGWIERQRRSLRGSGPAPVQTVTVGEKKIPYTITYQATRKKMVINVHIDGRVEIKVPDDAELETITAFVKKNVDWIRQIIDGEQKEQIPAGETREITVKGKVIPYTVRRSTRATRLSIKVHTDRSVEVVTPVAATVTDIEHLLSAKAEWVYSHVMSDARPVAVRRSFCDGEVYPLLGGTLTLKVTRGFPAVSVVKEGDFLKVGLPGGTPAALEQKTLRRAVEYTLKNETYGVVSPLVTHYTAMFGVVVPPIIVRNARRKWGSCNGRKKLLFSTHLCMLPPHLVHYVVAHEVCHMVVMDHSDRFWSALQVIMPDCRERAAELRRDSPLYQFLPA